MGHVIDVDQRVSVELRRESFIVHAEINGGLHPEDVHPEFDYTDVPALMRGLVEVITSSRYWAWRARRGRG